MKAAVLTSIPASSRSRTSRSTSRSPNEVLIRTVAAGLCHSDLHFMEGKYPYPTPAGARATSRPASSRRSATTSPTCSPATTSSPACRCSAATASYCLTRPPVPLRRQGRRAARGSTARPRLAHDGQPVYQFLDLSSFAEQMLVHENAVVKIREDMPLDRAALIGCGVTTGVGAVFNTAKVRAGQHGRRDRLRRRRAQLRSRAPPSPAPAASSPSTCVAVEARAGRAVRRHRHRRRVAGRPGAARCRSSPAAASTTPSRRSA